MTKPAINQKEIYDSTYEGIDPFNRQNIYACPSCGFMSLSGMPGGRDAVCQNCGFKEPCCSDSSI